MNDQSPILILFKGIVAAAVLVGVLSFLGFSPNTLRTQLSLDEITVVPVDIQDTGVVPVIYCATSNDIARSTFPEQALKTTVEKSCAPGHVPVSICHWFSAGSDAARDAVIISPTRSQLITGTNGTRRIAVTPTVTLNPSSTLNGETSEYAIWLRCDLKPGYSRTEDK